MLSFILLQRHFRFEVTANDFQAYIVLLGGSKFSKKPGIDHLFSFVSDEAGKVFSSNLKGAASKNFSEGGAPRPLFSLLHFSMNPVIGDSNRGLACTVPQCISSTHACRASCQYSNFPVQHGHLFRKFIGTEAIERSDENSVIVGILSFYDPRN